jgi:hypothetical protein
LVNPLFAEFQVLPPSVDMNTPLLDPAAYMVCVLVGVMTIEVKVSSGSPVVTAVQVARHRGSWRLDSASRSLGPRTECLG